MNATANRKQAPSRQAILKTLDLTGTYAFKFLRKGKWRHAEKMAQDLLRELPPSMRKSADAVCLRMIGKAGRYIADWFVAERAERARRRTRKRALRPQDNHDREANRLHVAQLLLVPEAPGVDLEVTQHKFIPVEKS